MTRIRHLAIAGLAAVFATAAVQAASGVYKWTDEKGVVHYTDAPPDGRPFERMNVKAGTSRAAQTEDDSATAEAADGNAPPSPADRRRLACEQARQNVQTFKASDQINMDIDDNGTSELLTPEQHAQQLARNEALVVAYCDGAAETPAQ